VLVDLDARDSAEVEHLAARDHRPSQLEGLMAGHPSNAHRHQPRRHLVVRDLPAQVARQQKLNLFARVLAAIPLAADDLEDLHPR
jgi:hypothetical protein